MSKDAVGMLIVDDDPVAGGSLADFLCEEGYEARAALGGEEALKALAAAEAAGKPVAIAICDVAMPGMTGHEVLRRIGREHPATAVLMLTGYGTIESAVEAVRLGAVDYLTKPVVDSELRLALERALRQHRLMSENRTLRKQLDDRFGLDNIVGSDHRMLKIYDLVEAVAASKTTVLMNGESGVGKSLIAHAIHLRSNRRNKPFIQLSCGSIPETLLESELFGHVKGAFTGAHADKVGRFLAADGGTIFLDEINSASPAMQLKLLRVLQERKFEPVGSSQTIEVDVRVVLATNKPLEELVARGEFRQDLYYRVNVVGIDLPPLRERVSDIPLLAEHFLKKHGAALGRTYVGFSPEAMDALRRYRYPGNVRELENIVERASVLAKTPTIGLADLPEQVADPDRPARSLRLAGDGPAAGGGGAGAEPAWQAMPLEEAMKEPERRILLRALKANHWNRQKTAEDLKINRTTLYKKMKALGIEGGGGGRGRGADGGVSCRRTLPESETWTIVRSMDGSEPAIRDGLPAGKVRGRGAGINPGNRFEDVRLHVLGDHLDEVVAENPDGTKVTTRVYADRSRSIINRVDSPDLPFDWTINPYRGCEHGCIYCYARPGHEYLGMSCGLDFETKIMAKYDAAALLREELGRKGWEGEPISVSGVTDCYQPIEAKLRITRAVLEVCAEFAQPVTLVTKNKLILRDLDLLGELARHGAVGAAVSITTLDNRLASIMEPRASAPRDRLMTIEQLTKAGVPAMVMVAPIIPAINESEAPAILKAAAEAGAVGAGYVALRLPHQIKDLFLDWLKRHFPDRAAKVEKAIREMRGGELYSAEFFTRHKGQGERADQIGEMFELFKRRYGLKGRWGGVSSEEFKRRKDDRDRRGQMGLWS